MSDEAQIDEVLQTELNAPAGRKLFTDELTARVREFVTSLTSPDSPTQIPELQGLAIAFIWDLTIPAGDLAFGLVGGRDMADPLAVLRGYEQTTKLLRHLMVQTYDVLQRADTALETLNRQIHERRTTLEQIETRIADAKGASAQRSETPGAGASQTS